MFSYLYMSLISATHPDNIQIHKALTLIFHQNWDEFLLILFPVWEKLTKQYDGSGELGSIYYEPVRAKPNDCPRRRSSSCSPDIQSFHYFDKSIQAVCGSLASQNKKNPRCFISVVGKSIQGFCDIVVSQINLGCFQWFGKSIHGVSFSSLTNQSRLL